MEENTGDSAASNTYQALGWHLHDDRLRWWDGQDWWDRSALFDLLQQGSHSPEDSEPLPGFLTSPSGTTQWWDGRRFLSDTEVVAIISAPKITPVVERNPGRSGARAGWVIAAAAAAGIVFVGALNVGEWFFPKAVPETSEQAVEEVPVAKEELPPTPEEILDSEKVAEGYQVIHSGRTWMRDADLEGFVCRQGTKCLKVELLSAQGCDMQYTVELNFWNREGELIGTKVTLANPSAPNVPTEFTLNNLPGEIDKFLVDKVYCATGPYTGELS